MSFSQTLSQKFISTANPEVMVPLSLSHGHGTPMVIVSKYCTYEIAPLADPRTKFKSSDEHYCI